MKSNGSLSNSSWPSDAIWRQGSESTLAQVMVCCFTAPSHYWTTVDLSSVRSCGIHLRTISQEMLKMSILDMSLKIINLRLHLHLLVANEFLIRTLCRGSGIWLNFCYILLTIWISHWYLAWVDITELRWHLSTHWPLPGRSERDFKNVISNFVLPIVLFRFS